MNVISIVVGGIASGLIAGVVGLLGNLTAGRLQSHNGFWNWFSGIRLERLFLIAAIITIAGGVATAFVPPLQEWITERTTSTNEMPPGGGGQNPGDGGPGNTKNTAPTQPPPTGSGPAKPPETMALFNYPHGNTVQPSQPQQISVTVSDLGQAQLWVVTKPDEGDGKYYLTTDGPLTDENGTHSFTDLSVGDSSDRGHNIEYIAIKADLACTNALAKVPEDPDADGNKTFITFPEGCTPLTPRGILRIAS